ncbi:MAG: hypothetical protein ACOX2Z_03715 [Minisyncoccales bacterium]|jgi:hypothetical protein
MSKQLSNIIKLSSLSLAVVLSVFLVTLTVSAAWTQPPASPPNCPSGQPGCDTPVHVGSTTQAKSGALGVGGVFQTNSSTYLAAVNGNVGIGTTSPQAKLDINTGAARVKTFPSGFETTVNAAGGWARSLRLRNEYNDVSTAFGSLNGAAYIATGFNISSDPTGYGSPHLYITPAGNVGIGTTNPQARFDVRKDAKFYDSGGNLVLTID